MDIDQSFNLVKCDPYDLFQTRNKLLFRIRIVNYSSTSINCMHRQYMDYTMRGGSTNAGSSQIDILTSGSQNSSTNLNFELVFEREPQPSSKVLTAVFPHYLLRPRVRRLFGAASSWLSVCDALRPARVMQRFSADIQKYFIVVMNSSSSLNTQSVNDEENAYHRWQKDWPATSAGRKIFSKEWFSGWNFPKFLYSCLVVSAFR